MADRSYWESSRVRSAISRRRALGVGAAGLGGLFAAACGGSNNNSGNSSKTVATTAPSAAAATGASPAATVASTAAPQAPAGPSAAATAAADKPVRGGTLRRGTWLNVLGIDPHIEVSVGLIMVAGVYTHLGAINNVEQKWHPIFAESVEQKSPTEFVFKLRSGVKFHNIAPVNGREVVADDLLYSYQRIRDEPRSQGGTFFKSFVDKMEAVDPHTFRLTTKQPYSETLTEVGEWNRAVVAREAVEKFGDLSQNAIGAGPYMLDEYVKGEKTNLKRNPDYFDKTVAFPDAIKWTTILDLNTLVQAYKNDQFDIGAGPYEGALLTKLDYDDLKGNAKLITTKMPALHYGYFGVNASQKPFDDPRVRQALWLAVDRSQFVDKVFLGEGTPQAILNNGLTFWALSQDEIKPYVTTDLKKAKDLLTAAGYPNGFDLTIDSSGGVQLYIDHLEVLIPQLKKIGVNVTPRLSDLPSFLSDRLFQGKFDSVVLTGNPYETPMRPLDFYHKNGVAGLNWYHYDNAKVNGLVDAQKGELDINKRQALVKDAQRAILEDWAPLMSFVSPTLFLSQNKRVGGFDPTQRKYVYYTYGEYLKPNG